MGDDAKIRCERCSSEVLFHEVAIPAELSDRYSDVCEDCANELCRLATKWGDMAP